VSKQPNTTILDVLDNAFGGRPPRTFPEVEELLDRLDTFWKQSQPSARQDDEIRLMSVGDIASGWVLSAAAACIEPIEVYGRMPDKEDVLEASNASAALLLTADRVACTDPLFRQTWYYRGEENVLGLPDFYYDQAVRFANDYWNQVHQARPLIEAGLLMIVPSDGNVEAAQGAMRAFAWEGAYTYSGESIDDVIEQNRVDAYLAAASYADAALVPVGEFSSLYWEELIRHGAIAKPSRSGRLTEPRIAAALAHASIPVLYGLDASTFVRVHQEEDAFASWREGLRQAGRSIASLPTDRHFETESRAIFQDFLNTTQAATRRALSRSAALRSALRDEPMQAALGAIATGGAAAAMGQSVSAVAVSAATGAASRIGYAAVRRPRPEGAAAVIALLTKRRRKVSLRKLFSRRLHVHEW
jgi:hypothetical protein